MFMFQPKNFNVLIVLYQTPEITYSCKNETDKKYIRKSKRKQIVDTNVFMDDIRYLQVREFDQAPEALISCHRN